MSPLAREYLKKEYDYRFKRWATDAFLNTSHADCTDTVWFEKCFNSAIDKVRNEKPILIGLCGNMGVGKDSSLDYILNHINTRCTRIAFADPIREIGKIFGFTMEQMTDRRLKEELDDFWKFSPRYFMQKVGTEMFREHLREDVWIDLFRRKMIDLEKPFVVQQGYPSALYGTYRIIFVTDVRFPNEAKAIRDLGGYIFKISRDGFNRKGEDLHPSERFVSQIQANMTLENNASNAEEWSWKAARNICQFFKPDAFYYN